MPHHRRRSRLRRLLSMAGGVSATALLLFAGSRGSLPPLPRPIASWPLQPFPQTYFSPPPPELLHSWEPSSSFPRKLFPGRQQSPPPPQLQHDDAVLLPDDEVLVLAAEPAVGSAMCVFNGGVPSQARALGRLPGPGRHAYLCPVPSSVQQQPLQAPSLIPSSSAAAAPLPAPAAPARAQLAAADLLLNWNDTSLVFDSALLEGGGGDLLVFAKGRRRQGVSTSPSQVHCLYSGTTVHGSMVASFPAITAAQQLIRCPPPPTSLHSGRITVAVKDDEPLPSLASFSSRLSVTTRNKKLICACTMVRNVAKFLPEWVRYHAAIGVEQFFIYDNGSEDDLADQVGLLQDHGFGIVTVAWPWVKTQEAGLSHCVAIARSSCEWMAFMDVDEFIFSPAWNILEKPSRSMLEALVVNPQVDPQVGQVYLRCFDFGPSGQTSHPMEGVCQGYTCRVKKVTATSPWFDSMLLRIL